MHSCMSSIVGGHLNCGCIIPAVSGGDPSPFCHTHVSVAGIHPPFIIPAVSGGYPSEGNQDGFPIKNVGNDGAGERSPLHHVGNDNPFSHPRSVWRRSIRNETKRDSRFTVIGWIYKKYGSRGLRGAPRRFGLLFFSSGNRSLTIGPNMIRY